MLIPSIHLRSTFLALQNELHVADLTGHGACTKIYDENSRPFNVCVTSPRVLLGFLSSFPSPSTSFSLRTHVVSSSCPSSSFRRSRDADYHFISLFLIPLYLIIRATCANIFMPVECLAVYMFDEPIS